MIWKKTILSVVFSLLLCATAQAYDIKLLSEIPLKGKVTGVALNPVTDTAVAASAAPDLLSVINTVTNVVTHEVALPEPPLGVAVNINNNTAVAFSAAGTLFVIDLGKGEVVTALGTGKAAYALAFDDLRNKAVVGVDGGLMILDPAGGPTANIAFDGKCVLVAIGKNGYYAVVKNDTGTLIRLIDPATGKVARETGLSGEALSIALDDTLGCLLVTQTDKPGLLLFDSASLLGPRQIQTGKQFEIVVVNSSAHTAVLANTQEGSITVIDLEQKLVLASLPLFGQTGPIGVDTGRNRALVAHDQGLALIQLENPVPSVVSIVPQEGAAGENDLPLTISGTKFLKESQAWFSNWGLATLFRTNELLQAFIPSDRLRYPGDVAVSVVNPPPGGGKSNELKFKVLTPVPQLASLTPATAVTAQPFNLRVDGQNFLPSAVISLGKKLATKFNSSTYLEAPVDGSLLVSAGNLPVTVTNSGQTSFTSNVLNLQVMTAEEAAAQAKKTVAAQTVAAGTGSLGGRILNTVGQPVVGVTIRCKGIKTQTDDFGNFTLENLPAGKRTILIDGSTAVDALGHYPTIPISADITANQHNLMPFTPYLHRQKHYNFAEIEPATDTVLTDPEIPGFEMRIPKGVKITGWDGKTNLRVSVRTVPVNRLPIKQVPANSNIRTVYMYYFDKVGGGKPDRPIPLKAPNDLGLLPGEKAVLWYYDESPNEGEAPNDWAVAGTGTVTPDGRFIVTDPGVGIPKFCCGASGFGGNGSSLPTSCKGSHCSTAEPVDTVTGYYMYEKTDLVIPGIIPVKIKRHYRSRDGGIAVTGSNTGLGAFGKGMYFEYDWWLGTYNGMLRLTKPGTYQYDFALQPDGSYANTADPEFGGAKVTVNADGTKVLRMRDGWTYNFNSFGDLVQVADRNGNAINITRVHDAPGGDEGGRISQITNAEGKVITFNETWTGTGGLYRIDSITDNMGRTVTYTYDNDPFNSFPRLRQVSYPDSTTIQYGYDPSTGLMTTVTNGRGVAQITNAYDASYRVTQQTLPDGAVYTFNYGTAGQTTMTAPNGAQTTWAYNGYNYVSQVVTPDGTTSYVIAPGTNRLTSFTDPLNRTTSYTYYSTNDAKNGLVQTVTDPLYNVTAYDYETTYGLLTKITDPLSKVTTIAYTPSGAPPTQAVITDPLSNQTTVNFNSYGMPTGIVDPNTNTTTLTFDPNRHGELVGITDALNNSVSFTYDNIGRLASRSDAKGAQTFYGYDVRDRVNSVTDPHNNDTYFEYDQNGNLATVFDANMNFITYEYDSRDRIIKMTDQLGRYENYSYYTGSQITATTGDNLKSYTDRKGQTTTFNQYDSMDRLKQVTFNDSSTVQLSYDAIGRATNISDSVSGTIGYTYNDFGCTNCSGRGLNRIAQETTPLSSVSYTYDVDRRRASMTVAGELVVIYTYDDSGRLTGINRNVGGTSRTYNLGYDNAGRRTSLQIPLANGTDYVTTTYGYDNANRLLSMIQQGASSIIESLSYSYDPNGNRQTFGRIAAQALSPAVSVTNYDAANEMLGYNNKNVTYDANGNLQTKTDSCGTTTYAWDARNRLTGISGYKPDCSTLTASFSYDATNRRISKTINGATSQYVYDGLDVIQEIVAGVKTNYVRTLNIDEPLTRINGTSTRHYVRDALGSIVALADDTGATKTTYVYDAFGNVTATGETSDNPFQYTGRENDGTGLYYYRARYYSPEMQRFISEDPIRLRGGINYYLMVQNNPINKMDPYGLWDLNDVIDTANEIINVGTPVIGLARNFARLPKSPIEASIWGVDLLNNKVSVISGLLPCSENKKYLDFGLGIVGVGTAVIGDSAFMAGAAGYVLGNAINEMPVGNSNFKNFLSDILWGQ